MKKMKFISVLLLSVLIVLSGCDMAGVSVEENVISENEIPLAVCARVVVLCRYSIFLPSF